MARRDFWHGRSTAMIGIIWSPTPGCFERHLQRRYNNPLFPPNRRIVTQSEVEEARARDTMEAESLRGEVKEVLKLFLDLNPGQKIEMTLGLDTARRLDGLIERAARLGGDSSKEEADLITLRKALAADMKRGAEEANAPGLREALGELDLFLQILVKGWSNRFLAQMGRKDSPILPEDVVPSLLSEDKETIRLVVESFAKQVPEVVPPTFLHDPDIARRASEVVNKSLNALDKVRQAAFALVADLEAKGESTQEMDEKLRVLGAI